MTEPDPASTEAAPEAQLPLFYRQPEVLTPDRHAGLRLRPGDWAFAANTNSAPIMASEFAAAAAHYPVVFDAVDAAPIVVLGLERDNLFVDGEGRWDPETYVPAYVRRYPFITMSGPNDTFTLVIDRACDRLADGGEAGEPLFVDGQPSAFTRSAVDFSRAFLLAHRQTLAFGAALQEAGLLIPQQVDARLPDGRPLQLAGWRRIDLDKFQALDEARLVAWHRNGWLGLAHRHLASLDRFQALLTRLIARQTGEPAGASAPARSRERREKVGA